MVQENLALFPKFIYLYCDDEEEVKKITNHIEYGKLVCNCDQLNPIIINKVQTALGKNHSNALNDISKRKI